MILVKNPHFLHSWSVLARIDQEKMFTDVLNKKEDNIAHDDDDDDDENRLCPRFSPILSIGSSLKCFDRDCPGYQRSFSRFGLRFGMLAERVTKELTETGNRARKVSGTQGTWRQSLGEKFEKKFTAKGL